MKSKPSRKSPASTDLPESIREFVARQVTLPLTELFPNADAESGTSMYSQYWFRAVLAMLLSGRVSPRSDGRPNLTDTERVCKEANFHPGWFQTFTSIAIAAGAIGPDERQKEFVRRPGFDAFETHDSPALQALTGRALINLIQDEMGSKVRRSTFPSSAHLLAFVTLFAAAFRHVVVPESDLGALWYGFSDLPTAALQEFAQRCRLSLRNNDIATWHHSFDSKGVTALKNALLRAWRVFAERRQKETWIGFTPDALSMLGLSEPLGTAELPTALAVEDSGLLRVGAGVPMELLARFCRFCRIVRIRETLEFQIDPKRLAQQPASELAIKQLRALIEPAGPLPDTVEAMLGTKRQAGGLLRIAYCSAIVKPEDGDVAKAVRQHPKLKGYLAPKAPAGYLLIKPGSNPNNFVLRCRELGFQVRLL